MPFLRLARRASGRSSAGSGDHDGVVPSAVLADGEAPTIERPPARRKVQVALATGVPVRGRAIASTGAGVLIDLAGVRGFVRRRDLPWANQRDPSLCVGSEL